MKSLTKELKSNNLGKARDTFHKIFTDFEGKIYAFALSHSKNKNDAQDIVQEVFLRIWEKRAQLNENLSLESQLFQITKNILIDNYRKRLVRLKYIKLKQLEQKPAYSTLNPLDKQLANEKSRFVLNAIEELPERRKLIFKLSRFEGLTYNEIALRLSISQNTVQVQISKALSYLRKRLVEMQLIVTILLSII